MAKPEVTVYADFLSESGSLYWSLSDSLTWDHRLRARKTASFGVPYNYSGIEYEYQPFPTLLQDIAAEVNAACSIDSNNCLVNYYPDGGSKMGFHSDSTVGLEPGTGVAIVSLGARRTLTFRRKNNPAQRYEFPLESGALLFMPNAVQHEWQHGLLPVPGAGGRMSLSYRQIAFSH